MATQYIDFEDLKSRCSLEQAMRMVGLKLTKSGAQFRGSCPIHGGGPRTLVVTPGRGFYCFAEKQGGDQISLVAHVRELPVKEAAAWMLEQIGGKPEPARKAAPAARSEPTAGLKPLDYLETDHEALELLGLSPLVCESLGIGFAPKGTMANRVLIPLRLPDGTLVGYQGIATREDLIPLIAFPKNLEERCGVSHETSEEPEPEEQPSPDTLRRMFRVV